MSNPTLPTLTVTTEKTAINSPPFNHVHLFCRSMGQGSCSFFRSLFHYLFFLELRTERSRSLRIAYECIAYDFPRFFRHQCNQLCCRDNRKYFFRPRGRLGHIFQFEYVFYRVIPSLLSFMKFLISPWFVALSLFSLISMMAVLWSTVRAGKYSTAVLQTPFVKSPSAPVA